MGWFDFLFDKVKTKEELLLDEVCPIVPPPRQCGSTIYFDKYHIATNINTFNFKIYQDIYWSKLQKFVLSGMSIDKSEERAQMEAMYDTIKDGERKYGNAIKDSDEYARKIGLK